MQDLSINSSEILQALTPDELELFRKTNLYKYHFSSELVLFKCNKSEIYQEYGDEIEAYYLYYNVFAYDGTLKLSSTYRENDWIKILAELVTNFIACRQCDPEPVPVDIRYYKNHPYDQFILVFSGEYELMDYQCWLLQGNKPRYMWCFNTGEELLINPEIIYLVIACDCEITCNQMKIPKQILFLASNYILHINPDDFIACELLDRIQEYNINTSEIVHQAFYYYTFKRQGVKSARNS